MRPPFQIVLLALLIAGPAHATTILPVSFNDLVARADVIFIGEVVDVRPYAATTRDRTVIKTRVVFSVSERLLGAPGSLEVFDFFGGELNGMAMGIADMPRFAVGDRRVVFARRDGSINPIVGFTQGLMQIASDDAGVERVMTLEGTPIERPESIGTSAVRSAGPRSAAMRLSDFRAQVRRAVAGRRP